MNDSAAEVPTFDMYRRAKLVSRSLTIVLVLCGTASAQSVQNDDANRLAAIRAACAEDAQRLCAGVPPGWPNRGLP